MNYSKQYKRVIIILIFLMIIILGLFMAIGESSVIEKVSSILGNAFAGLITGLIILIIGNYKNIQLSNYEKKIKQYDELILKGRTVNNKIYEINNKEIIDLIELYLLCMEIYNFISTSKEYLANNVLVNNGKEINLVEKCKEILELLENIKNDIEHREDEVFLSKQEYNGSYRKEIVLYIIPILSLVVNLNDNLQLLEKEHNNLSNTIV